MILEKDVLVRGFKGYGGFCVLDKQLERFANPDKRRKVMIEIIEDK